MTPSGEIMLRIKALVVCGASSASGWRQSRARALATMIAWHRRSARLDQPGAPFVKRIILEDIVPDCGWPKLSWLKPAVRAEQHRIRASLEEAGRLADEDF